MTEHVHQAIGDDIVDTEAHRARVPPIRIGRRQVLLFISEHSRLPVLLPVREADHLASAFQRRNGVLARF
jgi:hypothetical protein